MLKISHRSFALSLTPLLFISVPQVKYFEVYINKYNIFFSQIYTNFSIENLFLITLFFITYFIGSTLPDIDNYLKVFYSKENKDKRYLYHRQITHGILLTTLMLFISLHYMDNDISFALLLGLTLGIITHQIGDMLTGSIPILFYAPYYVRFARLGITVFLPKSLHYIFTEKFPKYLNKNFKIIFSLLFLINLSILFVFKF